MRIFDHKHETIGRETLEQFQLERLQALLARLKRNVRRHRERMGDLRVESLADLAGSPATEPEDLLDAHPYGMFALPLQEVMRLHSAVGPHGRQLVIGHTRNDLTQWGRLAARQLAAAGVTEHDVIQLCFGGIFQQALGYMLGAELIEASVMPEDPFHVEYQLAMLQNYRATALITTPTNAWELVELLGARRVDPQSLSLRTVLLSRPVSAADREGLKTGLFADVRCNFGVAEVLDPGLCVECEAGRFHVNEDHFIVESRDGELVVTTLCREAMPLWRYGTRVSCELSREKCPCGRTGVVIRPGDRRDGRLRVREAPLYRAQIEEVLGRTRAAGHPFDLEIVDRVAMISLPVTADLLGDTVRSIEDLKRQIQSDCLSRLGVEADVRLVAKERQKG